MSLQFAQFVKIANRDNGYTSGKKAYGYCARGLAVPVEPAAPIVVVSEIRMLEAAELAMQRSHSRAERDPVTGAFHWCVGDSGGSRLMKEYEGISGGYRVLQAQHGDRN